MYYRIGSVGHYVLPCLAISLRKPKGSGSALVHGQVMERGREQRMETGVPALLTGAIRAGTLDRALGSGRFCGQISSSNRVRLNRRTSEPAFPPNISTKTSETIEIQQKLCRFMYFP